MHSLSPSSLVGSWFFLLVNRWTPAEMLSPSLTPPSPHFHVKLDVSLAPSIGLVPKLVIKPSAFLHELQSILYCPHHSWFLEHGSVDSITNRKPIVAPRGLQNKAQTWQQNITRVFAMWLCLLSLPCHTCDPPMLRAHSGGTQEAVELPSSWAHLKEHRDYWSFDRNLVIVLGPASS